MLKILACKELIGYNISKRPIKEVFVKITNKVLCIPPYISTTWDKVCLLETSSGSDANKVNLILHLDSGVCITIPALDLAIIDLVFAAHARYLETKPKDNSMLPLGDMQGVLPFKLGLGGQGIENFESMMQHNPSQSNGPILPPEVLEKIVQITKIMTGPEAANLLKAEPHCNCMHCQLARAFNGQEAEAETPEEEIVEEDLKFCSWNVDEIGQNLYSVQNKLDPKEQYNVYLGSPIGCTCGHKNCEHIKTVLET